MEGEIHFEGGGSLKHFRLEVREGRGSKEKKDEGGPGKGKGLRLSWRGRNKTWGYRDWCS